jgi:hypothetical protein
MAIKLEVKSYLTDSNKAFCGYQSVLSDYEQVGHLSLYHC